MTLRVKSALKVRPYPGFTSCGDAGLRLDSDGVSAFVLVDALGHGPDAAKSAQTVAESLRALGPVPLRSLFSRADAALAGLREVVMAAIRVEGDQAVFAGIGNIEIFGPESAHRPASMVGRLGRGLKRFREESLSLSPGDRWAIVTDGVRYREMKRAFAATSALPLEDAASQLLEQLARPDDDASIFLLEFQEAA